MSQGRLQPYLAPLILATLLSACGGTAEFPLVGSSRAPGADGTVQIEQIEGGNRLVTIGVTNLLPPARLGRGLTTYVVWFDGNNQTLKAGTLQYDDDNREGHMMATTPMASFTVKITAERNANVGSPSDVVVASRRVASE